jgi:hypothetical protein
MQEHQALNQPQSQSTKMPVKEEPRQHLATACGVKEEPRQRLATACGVKEEPRPGYSMWRKRGAKAAPGYSMWRNMALTMFPHQLSGLLNLHAGRVAFYSCFL